MEDLDEHVQWLREQYVNATLRQRLNVALKRVDDPNCGPNRVIHGVSAVEGMARAIALHLAIAQGDSQEHAYRRLLKPGPVQLVKEHIASKLGTMPSELFGPSTWADFGHAVKYRNLLIHECTFLRGEIAERLVVATRGVLDKLQVIASKL